MPVSEATANSPRPSSEPRSFVKRLIEPVNAGLLVFFRIAFGLLMAWEASRYLTSRFRGMDWIQRLYLEPQVHLKYYGFEWIAPWPGDGMYYHFWALGILALLIAVGFFYRLAMTLFFLGFTFIFLQDQAAYLNHFYLISLVSFLMIFLPLNCAWSVDARIWPRIRRITAPAWTLWLLRFQVGIAYTYGGIAKLNWDWLRGEPMRGWVMERVDRLPGGNSLISSAYGIMASLAETVNVNVDELLVYFFSWGGLLFDLLIVPALLWRPTRIPAFLLALFFHFSNDQMFQIGVFAWFMVAGTLMFMPSEWVSLDSANKDRKPASVKRKPPEKSHSLSRQQKLALALLGLWVAFQTLVPFRHFLYPGNVSWTEEGHRFAWHMKLRSKTAHEFRLIAPTRSGRELAWYLGTRVATDETTGRPYIDPNTGETFYEEYLGFYAIDAQGNRIELENPAEGAITLKQLHGVTTKPDMLLQFAHFLGRRLRERGYKPLAVYARVSASLNNRPPQTLIDPEVDLLQVERSLAHADWIVPLTTPLKPSWQPDPNNEAPTATSNPE